MSEISLKPDDLPSTWALTSLGAVVDYGSTTKAEPSQISDEDWILELEDIEKDSSRLLQRVTFAQRQSKSTKSQFQAGDVLYGKLRPYLNKVLIADRAGYCTTEIVPIEAGPELDKRYLFYWLKHPAFLKYVEAESHGMNMPRLGTDTAKAAPFVLAPRSEQTRIADQLDKLLARVQTCNNRIDAMPALLKRFRQAVLDAATSGILTEDWRVERMARITPQAEFRTVVRDSAQLHYAFTATTDSEAEDWQVTTVSQIASAVFDGPFGSHLKSDDYSEVGVRVVRLENIGWLSFAADKETFIPEEKYESLVKHTLQADDVLLSSFIAEEVRVCLAPTELDRRAINKADCFCIRVNQSKCIPKFLALRLACKSTYSTLKNSVHGATRPRINLGQLRAFEFPLPFLIEQAEIVHRVEALFKLADRIEARYKVVRAQAQRLTSLLLAKAFRGELVPQDPNDEPARVLLERIAAERAKNAIQPHPHKPAAGRKPARTPKSMLP